MALCEIDERLVAGKKELKGLKGLMVFFHSEHIQHSWHTCSHRAAAEARSTLSLHLCCCGIIL